MKPSETPGAAALRLARDAGPNGAVLAMHLLLALYVSLRGYPATQDGPAHLYAVHILSSIATDPHSPFSGSFVPNLHPRPNSLFSYLVLAGEGHLGEERIVSLIHLGALIALPLSVMAFARALRAQARAEDLTTLPLTPATSLACVAAYNYFLQRGFYNYVLGVSLAFACLAAVLAVGRPRASAAAVTALGAAAVVSAVLAALAHPSAALFILAALAAIALAAPWRSRVVALVTAAAAIACSLAVLRGAGVSHVEILGPVTSVVSLVRALGVTHTWLEVLPAVALLAVAGRGAWRTLSPAREVVQHWRTAWPAVLAVAMLSAYFFVPHEYDGLAGLNERIPLISVLLLLPYVPVTATWRRQLPIAFALFCGYTAATSAHYGRIAERIRDSPAVDHLPSGSRVVTVTLDVKLGSLADDLGRHILADVARRHDLVTGAVFCGHPLHVLRCTPGTPAEEPADAVQWFEHLSPAQRAAALEDAGSPIRASFAHIAAAAASADYLLVLGSRSLDDAFDAHVATPLHAHLVSPKDDRLRAYDLRTDAHDRDDGSGPFEGARR